MGLNGTESVFEWYAIHVRSQHEWLVQERISGETFLPTFSSESRWSDRVKVVEKPVFPGYLFSRFDISERGPILRVPGVIQILGIAGQPVPIAEQEISAIRRMLESPLPVSPHLSHHEGEKVMVMRGPLKGIEGKVLRIKKGAVKLVVAVEMMGRGLAVTMDSDAVRSI